jgi:hypothetical protein
MRWSSRISAYFSRRAPTGPNMAHTQATPAPHQVDIAIVEKCEVRAREDILAEKYKSTLMGCCSSGPTTRWGDTHWRIHQHKYQEVCPSPPSAQQYATPQTAAMARTAGCSESSAGAQDFLRRKTRYIQQHLDAEKVEGQATGTATTSTADPDGDTLTGSEVVEQEQEPEPTMGGEVQPATPGGRRRRPAPLAPLSHSPASSATAGAAGVSPSSQPSTGAGVVAAVAHSHGSAADAVAGSDQSPAAAAGEAVGIGAVASAATAAR